MKIISAIFLSLSLVFGVAFASTNSSVPPQKKQLIVKLLQLTQMDQMTSKLSRLMSMQMFFVMRRQNPNLPKGAVHIIQNEVNKMVKVAFNSPGGIKEKTIEIYSKNFSEDDLKALVNFYESPIGRKVITKMPVVIRETMQASQEVMMKYSPKMQQDVKMKLEKAGYLKQK